MIWTYLPSGQNNKARLHSTTNQETQIYFTVDHGNRSYEKFDLKVVCSKCPEDGLLL